MRFFSPTGKQSGNNITTKKDCTFFHFLPKYDCWNKIIQQVCNLNKKKGLRFFYHPKSHARIGRQKRIAHFLLTPLLEFFPYCQNTKTAKKEKELHTFKPNVTKCYNLFILKMSHRKNEPLSFYPFHLSTIFWTLSSLLCIYRIHIILLSQNSIKQKFQHFRLGRTCHKHFRQPFTRPELYFLCSSFISTKPANSNCRCKSVKNTNKNLLSKGCTTRSYMQFSRHTQHTLSTPQHHYRPATEKLRYKSIATLKRQPNP